MTPTSTRGQVLICADEKFARSTQRDSHEALTRAALAERLAALCDYDFGGRHDPARRYRGPLYFLPARTLEDREAQALGIDSPHQLFGGVVPHGFVATKTITHPLVDDKAAAPPGWCRELARDLHEATLTGFAAFSAADLRLGGTQLLVAGPARIKPARGVGGNDQVVVADMDQLEAAIAAMAPDELAAHGAVIEQNLTAVETFSVGEVQLADRCISYWGRQRQAPNHRGDLVYGGSDLVAVRGRLGALRALRLAPEVETAVAQALRYDRAASVRFPALIASRRNYDVARGVDACGQWRCGVLEQSWRVGGASPAELAAFEAFADDPSLDVVEASCREVFGPCEVPPDAQVHYCGVDPELGALTKYSWVARRGNPA